MKKKEERDKGRDQRFILLKEAMPRVARQFKSSTRHSRASRSSARVRSRESYNGRNSIEEVTLGRWNWISYRSPLSTRFFEHYARYLITEYVWK